MTKALGIVKHTVNDYGAWRTVYDGVQPLRDKHGVDAASVLRDPGDPNTVMVLHWFPSVAQAEAFAGDPGLKQAMAVAAE